MILVYSKEITPRADYIFKLIFNQILKVEFEFTNCEEKFLKSVSPKINYSGERFTDEIYVKPNGLLSEYTLKKIEIEPVDFKGATGFFKSSDDSVFPFDIFSASFYIVTRYEEYFDAKRDKYRRFPSGQSILSKYNLLKKPVVNIWASWLLDEVKKKYPDFRFPGKRFDFTPTIDIDNAWAYKNKGFGRTVGALLKSVVKGNFSELNSRLKVLSGKEKDPYDTYNYLDSVFKGNENRVKFFFLLGDYGKFDKNISHKNPEFQKLIQKISQKYDVGIHPSFAGFVHGCHGKVIRENQRLMKITGKKNMKSRQHYLNLNFPKTFQNLVKAGILEDYTMGYADNTGFRAGICTPFYFYDLENDVKTDLLVVPFQVMDGTLVNYQSLSPEKSFKEISSIMQEVKNVGGTFVSIWHNESVNDQNEWKGFRQVFEKMHRLGFEWANEYAD